MQKENGMDWTQLQEGLTFDDVLLQPGYSEILPSEVYLKTKLTKTLSINNPLVSAAMDTVTESKMAIAMAQEGCLGIIHKNMSIEEQSKEVAIVKKFETGIISDPITTEPDQPLSHAIQLMKEHHISGIPVVRNGILVGIITNRDLRFAKNLSKPVDMVMTKKLITAQVGVSFEQAKELLHQYRIEKLLVVDENNKLAGLITIKDLEKTTQFPNASKDSKGRLMVGASVGTAPETMDRVHALVESGADVIVVDTAHGESKNVIEITKKIKLKYSHIELIVGNVASETGAQRLIEAGADAIKVGMGPGSICTTRVISGVGVPQLTAIINCSKACKKYGVSLIADGGIKFSGDIIKALAAGADTVMIGSLLAGTDESPGEIILYQGRSYKSYRGMGSLSAMQKGSKDRYGQSDIDEKGKLVPEGIEGRVPYRGKVSQVIYQLLGGIRSGMGYTGLKTISELQEKSNFLKISPAGLTESHVHDVIITHEAPNYHIQ